MVVSVTDIQDLLIRDCRTKAADDDGSLLLGVVIGLPLSLSLWALVLWGVWRLSRGAP